MPLLGLSQTKETRKERIAKENARTKKMQKDAEEGAIIFNKQSAFLINLRTDGWALGYEHGKFKKINKTNLWWFSLGERKNTKEEKLVTSINGQQAGNPFIYGKENNFYLLNIGFGQQRLLGGKGVKNGISVSAIYGGGVTLGMLKPYYLEVYKYSSPETEYIKYDDDNDRFLNPNYIIGAAPFGKGYNFSEIKYVPGVFAKGALRFDYGKLNDIVSALEIGVSAEYYTKKMPIVLLTKEKNFFVSGYVSLIFGSRK